MTRSTNPFAWAWPKGSHHLLLAAAILPDETEAHAAFRDWLATNKIESAYMRELRLLVTISARLSASLSDRAERARLIGVERMLWTQSRMAVQAAEEALRLFAANGIDVIILKGAARAAVDMNDLRGRVANDVDLLVRPADYLRSYELLTEAGWSGKRIDDPLVTGIPMTKGRSGNVDLHRYPYHQVIGTDLRGGDIWERVEPTEFLGTKVLVAGPTDRLLLAIAHGGIDGHAHSDWLVDSALLVQEGRVDWELFVRLVEKRRLEAYAAIALSYLAEEMRVPVPAGVLSRISSRARRNPFRLWSALLQSRPKRTLTPAVNVARGVFRGARQVSRGLTLWRLHRAGG